MFLFQIVWWCLQYLLNLYLCGNTAVVLVWKQSPLSQSESLIDCLHKFLELILEYTFYLFINLGKILVQKQLFP